MPRKAVKPVKAKNFRRAKQAKPKVRVGKQVFQQLVEKYLRLLGDPDEAKAAASREYALTLIEHDRAHPAGLKALLKKGNFTSLFLTRLSKYYPRISEKEFARLAETVQDAQQAKRLLENPALNAKQKFAIRETLRDLKFELMHPHSGLAESERRSHEHRISLFERNLSNSSLNAREKSFYNWVVAQAEGQRKKMIEHGLRVGNYQAKSVFRSHEKLCTSLGVSLDDCMQEAAIGIMDAVEKFDPSRGAKFSSYAQQRARGQILEYLRSKAATIRLPVNVLRKVQNEEAFAQARAELLEKTGSASSEQVREHAVKRLKELASARATLFPASGDQEFGAGEGKTTTRFDFAASQNSDPVLAAERNDLKEKMLKVCNGLSPQQARIIRLRYLAPESPYSVGQIAKIMEVSESNVSQVHNAAIRTLALRPDLRLMLGLPSASEPLTKSEVTKISTRLAKLFNTKSPTHSTYVRAQQ